MFEYGFDQPGHDLYPSEVVESSCDCCFKCSIDLSMYPILAFKLSLHNFYRLFVMGIQGQ